MVETLDDVAARAPTQADVGQAAAAATARSTPRALPSPVGRRSRDSRGDGVAPSSNIEVTRLDSQVRIQFGDHVAALFTTDRRVARAGLLIASRAPR